MEENNITIMVVRQSGKIRTVKIAPKKLYIFLSGLAGLVAAFLILLYGYIEAYQKNYKLANTVRSIMVSRETQTQADQCQSVSAPKESPAVPTKEALPPIEQGKSYATSNTALTPSSEAGLRSEKIIIEEFRVANAENPPSLTFSFRVRNIEKDEEPLSGYIAIIGTDGSNYSTFPEMLLGTNGEIMNYKQGERFSIRRFKYVQGSLPRDGTIRSYSELTVILYSIDGKVLFRETLSARGKNF